MVMQVSPIINRVFDVTLEGTIDPVELSKRELITGGGDGWSEFLADGTEVIHKAEPRFKTAPSREIGN